MVKTKNPLEVMKYAKKNTRILRCQYKKTKIP